MVCSESWMRELFQIAFTAGCVFGSLAGGIIGEKLVQKGDLLSRN